MLWMSPTRPFPLQLSESPMPHSSFPEICRSRRFSRAHLTKCRCGRWCRGSQSARVLPCSWKEDYGHAVAHEEADEKIDAWMADLLAFVKNIEAFSGFSGSSSDPHMTSNSYGLVPMSPLELKKIIKTSCTNPIRQQTNTWCLEPELFYPSTAIIGWRKATGFRFKPLRFHSTRLRSASPNIQQLRYTVVGFLQTAFTLEVASTCWKYLHRCFRQPKSHFCLVSLTSDDSESIFVSVNNTGGTFAYSQWSMFLCCSSRRMCGYCLSPFTSVRWTSPIRTKSSRSLFSIFPQRLSKISAHPCSWLTTISLYSNKIP